jgi:hypothetical protein
MRLAHALVLVLALAGCTRENGLYIGGDGDGGVTGDGGDDASMCQGCTDAGHDLRMPDLARPADLAGAMCGASGGCLVGPSCGGICCAAGERCENGVCRCGTNKACGVGEICASGGPQPGPGSTQCGFTCCGGAGNPCPL